MPDPVAEAQELLVDTIETFEKLEVVRALSRRAPRTTEQLVEELALPIDVARDTVRALAANKILVEQPDGWVINNILLFVDLVILPDSIDLRAVRSGSALISLILMVVGLIWEAS